MLMVDISKPRICIASSFYPHSEDRNLGVFIHEFAKRLQRHSVTALVITTSLGGKDKEYSVLDSVPVYRVVPTKKSIVKWLLYISRLFRRNDVIHVHFVDFVGAMFVLLGRLSNRPVVLTIHRADVLPTRSIVYNCLRFLAFRLASTITAVSSSSRKLAIEAGAPKEKTIVVYNAADETTFKPRSKEWARRRLELDLNLRVGLFVGFLTPRKGVEHLVEAWYSVIKDVRESLLVIIGEGSERKRLEGLTRNIGLTGKVKFLGKISKNLLSSYYNAADVFVLPSLHEGHAMVLLEAMASALPIVATNVGGNRETVIDEVNGYLVKPADPHELSEKIVRILRNEDLIRSFGRNSFRIYRERFCEDDQINIFKEIYSRLAKTKKKNEKGCKNLVMFGLS